MGGVSVRFLKISFDGFKQTFLSLYGLLYSIGWFVLKCLWIERIARKTCLLRIASTFSIASLKLLNLQRMKKNLCSWFKTCGCSECLNVYLPFVLSWSRSSKASSCPGKGCRCLYCYQVTLFLELQTQCLDHQLHTQNR